MLSATALYFPTIQPCDMKNCTKAVALRGFLTTQVNSQQNPTKHSHLSDYEGTEPVGRVVDARVEFMASWIKEQANLTKIHGLGSTG